MGSFWVAPVNKAAAQIYAAIEKKKKKLVYITHRWWLESPVCSNGCLHLFTTGSLPTSSLNLTGTKIAGLLDDRITSLTGL